MMQINVKWFSPKLDFLTVIRIVILENDMDSTFSGRNVQDKYCNRLGPKFSVESLLLTISICWKRVFHQESLPKFESRATNLICDLQGCLLDAPSGEHWPHGLFTPSWVTQLNHLVFQASSNPLLKHARMTRSRSDAVLECGSPRDQTCRCTSMLPARGPQIGSLTQRALTSCTLILLLFWNQLLGLGGPSLLQTDAPTTSAIGCPLMFICNKAMKFMTLRPLLTWMKNAIEWMICRLEQIKPSLVVLGARGRKLLFPKFFSPTYPKEDKYFKSFMASAEKVTEDLQCYKGILRKVTGFSLRRHGWKFVALCQIKGVANQGLERFSRFTCGLNFFRNLVFTCHSCRHKETKTQVHGARLQHQIFCITCLQTNSFVIWWKVDFFKTNFFCVHEQYCFHTRLKATERVHFECVSSFAHWKLEAPHVYLRPQRSTWSKF